jgi:catechol 2,3-dioxygenase-like lactoylglutathione lyase family enzyme
MSMAQTPTTTRITQVATVIVPVSDHDEALEFYVGTLGFEKRADFRYGDEDRWVEVAPAGAETRVSLVAQREGRPAAVETGVAFTTEDVHADHADLRGRGVDVDEAVMREGDPVVRWSGAALAGIPAMFLFRDPDGNSFLMVQRS